MSKSKESTILFQNIQVLEISEINYGDQYYEWIFFSFQAIQGNDLSELECKLESSLALRLSIFRASRL